MQDRSRLHPIRSSGRWLRGVTLMEMLTVVTIIGIMVLISLPNVMGIIQMNKFRTSTNDLQIKIRSARSLAIQTRRRLYVQIDLANESFQVVNPGYTEYNLLKNISEQIRKNQPLDNSYILFQEKGGNICVAKWDESRVTANSCSYYFGRNKKDNGIDTLQNNNDLTATAMTLVINPSGTFDDTYTLIAANTRLNRTDIVRLFKGGQVKVD